MNNRNLVISIIGVLVLLLSVIGATFAFFSYNKIGTKDNTITTGSLSFNYAEGTNALSIENMFPLTDAEGIALTGGTNTFTFTVSGYSSTTINYTIQALAGGEVSGKDPLNNAFVKAYLTGSASSGSGIATTFGPSVLNNVSTGHTLGTGYITGGTSGTPIVHTYTFRMWVSDDIVAVSDSETSIDGKTVLTSADYANKYFTVNIRVFAA